MTDNRLVFEIIDEADVTAELDTEIRTMLFEAFPDGRVSFAQTRHWHGSAPEYNVLCRIDGHIVGNTSIVVRDVVAGGQQVRIAGIQNLGVVPAQRGRNIGGAVLAVAMGEARRRGIPFGMLFCVPQLERFYGANGWRTIDLAVVMQYQGQTCPIPGKNIGMVLKMTGRPFPAGDVDLRGADW